MERTKGYPHNVACVCVCVCTYIDSVVGYGEQKSAMMAFIQSCSWGKKIIPSCL